MLISLLIYAPDSRRAQWLESTLYKIPEVEQVHRHTELASLNTAIQQNPEALLWWMQQNQEDGEEMALAFAKCKSVGLASSPEVAKAAQAYQQGALAWFHEPLKLQTLLPFMRQMANYLSLKSDANEEQENDFFYVKSDYKIIRLNVQDILFIESLGEYIRIYTETEKIVSLLSLSKLEQRLPPKHFARIHRSHIINLHRINFIQNKIVSIGKYQLPVSKSHYKALMEHIRKNGLF